MLVHSPGILLEKLRKTRITYLRIFSVSAEIRIGYILNSSKNFCQLNVAATFKGISGNIPVANIAIDLFLTSINP